MGFPKVGASVLLLLAVGPLLLFAPWWPLPPLVLAPLAVLAAVYVTFIIAIGYRWWATRQQEVTESPSPSESFAPWQAGHWDAAAYHAYLANIGETAAYDVTVTQGGTVICAAEVVPPFSARRTSWSSEPPWYLNLSVQKQLRASNLVAVQRPRSGDASPRISVGDVHIRWRTAFGQWRNQSATID